MVVRKPAVKGRWKEIMMVITGGISIVLQICNYFGIYDAESASLTQKEKNILLDRSKDLIEEKKHFLDRTFTEYSKSQDPVLAAEMQSIYLCYQEKEYSTCMDKLRVLMKQYPDKEASLTYIRVSICMQQKLHAYVTHFDYGSMHTFFQQVDELNP